ncbi:MAG: hypothetical protein AB7G11_02280 [Phycisphaerales bacterium]
MKSIIYERDDSQQPYIRHVVRASPFTNARRFREALGNLPDEAFLAMVTLWSEENMANRVSLVFLEDRPEEGEPT